MQIVPVIDLLDAKVVHARGGRRTHYQPLQSRLTTSCEPRTVVAALLSLHEFHAVYIADLDAIMGRGTNYHGICAIAAQHPGLEIWLDGGFSNIADIEAYSAFPQVKLVLGTESQTTAVTYRELRAGIADVTRLVLSLDFRAGVALGPPELFADEESWPATVIAMNLDHVGVADGPDWSLLTDLKRRVGHRALAAAGGVRDSEDCRRLLALGIDYVLIATALHDGRLDRAALSALAAGTRD